MSLLCKFAKSVDFLSDVNVESKAFEKRRRVIEKSACGIDLAEILFIAAMSLW